MIRRSLRLRLTLLYAVPFFVCGAVLISIPLLGTRITQPVGAPGPANVTVHQPLAASAGGLAGMAALSLLLGWLIAGRFLRPLRTIIATARDISASNLHRRLALPGHNEFAALATTLDDLFARLEASFASQRHFVANAAHELRTPLTAQRALLQVALADPDAGTESLRSAGQEVLALGEAQARLIDALLTLATGERGLDRREQLDLATVAAGVLRPRPGGPVRINTTLAPAPVTGDPDLIESMIVNLIDNAVRHNVPDGWVTVETGDDAITVRNSGPAIRPDAVDGLFEPFRHRPGGGHGVGLAIVRAVAQAHAAALTAAARADGGLDVTVRFPTG